jgi:hypothetical protein
MIAAKVQWSVFWEVIVGEARQKKEHLMWENVRKFEQGKNSYREIGISRKDV